MEKYIDLPRLERYHEKISEKIDGKSSEITYEDYQNLTDEQKGKDVTYFVPDASIVNNDEDIVLGVIDDVAEISYLNNENTRATIQLADKNSVDEIKEPEFTEATSRTNIETKESLPTILGKIKKYFADLKTHTFNNPANNLTTTTSGTYSLDAYQGKLLNDKVSALQTPTFTQATSRTNIASGNSMAIILGKIMKYFTDLKTHAFNAPANNLTTTATGYALDATQGKKLQDKIGSTDISAVGSTLTGAISNLNSNLKWKKLYENVSATDKHSLQSLDEGTEILIIVEVPIAYDDGSVIRHMVSKRFIKGYDLFPWGNKAYFVEGGYYLSSVSRFCGLLVDADYNITCDSFFINGVDCLPEASIYVYYR